MATCRWPGEVARAGAVRSPPRIVTGPVVARAGASWTCKRRPSRGEEPQVGATLSRYLSSLIGLLVLLGTLLPLNVLAEDSGADAASEAIALEAAQVIDEHCAAAAGGSATAAAASVAIVSDVWRRVSEELETSRKVYLLYWRGVLGQCLDQEERALADLTEFVDARRGSDLWTSLVDDAKRRIVFLRRKAGRSGELLRARRTTAAGLGIGFSAGSVALAVGAGLEWSASQSVAELRACDKIIAPVG